MLNDILLSTKNTKEKTNMFKNFKEFAFKGNVIDMAVGVIIGTSFGKIVTSLVNDIVMPFFGYITAGMEFTDLKLQLGAEEGSAIMYGNFIQNIVDFLIIAISIFAFVTMINSAKEKLIKKQEEAPAPEQPKISQTDKLLTEIRDLLKND